jgi:hypothetical protein
VPGAPPLAQEKLDVRGGVELDADAGQRLPVRLEIEMLRIDENPVVVEQDRVDQ